MIDIISTKVQDVKSAEAIIEMKVEKSKNLYFKILNIVKNKKSECKLIDLKWSPASSIILSLSSRND